MSRLARRGQDVIKGSWSEAEDNQLRHLVEACTCNWSAISQIMHGRSAKQCRERWVQNLRPDIDHGPMTPPECAFITAWVDKIGQKWAEIARRLHDEGIGNRSDNAVKNWYNGTRNRQKRTAARQQRQSSTRGRAVPPAPLNLSQPQRELPPPVNGQATPTTPVNGDYGYAAHASHASHTSHHYSAYPRHAAHDRSPSAGPQLPPLQDALARDRSHDCSWPNPYYQQPPMALHSSTNAPFSHSHFQQQQQQQQRFSDRRNSAYTTVGSPRSDATEHHYVPSLISDAGSPPSARESPTHAPASPNSAIPPMSTLPAPNAMAEKEMAAHNLHSLRYRRSSSSMVRSWSSRSDEQYQYLPLPQPQIQKPRLPPPVPMEPSVLPGRPSSSGRAMDLNSMLNL
ncbi:hypothetical protein HMPREF1624_04408 [Sporothrix schenckii ATCC 58251]|uniref:Uncharacterized protein n=1 Tax=Sporothrix schenckii (strain ATCC 58251 / de Perez 2211183) TaxID=1391915 RepID=U7PXK9_SPOS1|nr:hypothetical protein HMPREF1624_04408 [Sporothrix schenckii ATCC 58251]